MNPTDALLDPSLTAVFVDDSGTQAGVIPREVLMPDYLLLAAVILPAGPKYLALERQMAQWKTDASNEIGAAVKELHTVEIVNPRSRSVWRDISQETRRLFLKRAYDLLQEYSLGFPFMGIGKEQYDELLAKVQELARPFPDVRRWSRQKYGLEVVFCKSLAGHLPPRFGRLVIVWDEDSSRSNELWQIFKPDVPVWSSGVVYLPSESCAGLQLADLTAYTFNRMFHIRNKELEGDELGPIDAIIRSYWKRMTDLKIDLLSDSS